MTCTRSVRSIEAYIDGECSAAETAALSQHIRDCSDCRNRAEELSALRQRVHLTLSAEKATPDLWTRVAGALDQAGEDSPGASPSADAMPPLRATFDGLRHYTMAAAIAVVLTVGGIALWPKMSLEQAVVHETVQDFVTFQLSGRPLDSEETDPAAVRNWFAGKVQFELPAMKAKAAGYELIGSRLCWLLERRLGAFTYRRGNQTMTLYVMDGDEVELPGGDPDPVLGALALRRRTDGYNSLVWRRGDLVFSLVSDAQQTEMTNFAAAVVGDDDRYAARRSVGARLSRGGSST